MRSALFTSVLLSAAAAVHAASFDCSKAGAAIDKAICASPRVSALDSMLSAAYKAAVDASADPAFERTKQRSWIKEARNICTTDACLVEAYENRITALAGPVKPAPAPAAAPPATSVVGNQVPAEAKSATTPIGKASLAIEAVAVADAIVPHPRWELAGPLAYDKAKNRTWQRCSVGQSLSGSECVGKPKLFTYEDAMAIAAKGWRLPTKDELWALVDYKVMAENSQRQNFALNQPTINEITFPGQYLYEREQHAYWSSTTAGSDDAWAVGFNTGWSSNEWRKSAHAVRLMMTGRSGMGQAKPPVPPHPSSPTFELKGLSVATTRQQLLDPKWQGAWNCDEGDSGDCTTEIVLGGCMPTMLGCKFLPVDLDELNPQLRNIATLAARRIKRITVHFHDAAATRIDFKLKSPTQELISGLKDRYGAPSNINHEYTRWFTDDEG